MQLLAKRQRQLGIGLLELMLSLAIIAILLIMATRYYQSASDANKRNQALDMFSATNAAVENYKIDNPGQVTTLTGAAGMVALIDAGYLPPSYGSNASTANPWGGDITVDATAADGTFTVTMTGVASNSCEAVGLRVNQTISGAGTSGPDTASGIGASCATGGNSVTATYNL